MSKALGNCFASIQRRLPADTLPRAKLQKSQAALQEFVTAILQSAGPPRRINFSICQVLLATVFMVGKTPREGWASVLCPQRLDAIGKAKDGERGCRKRLSPRREFAQGGALFGFVGAVLRFFGRAVFRRSRGDVRVCGSDPVGDG